MPNGKPASVAANAALPPRLKAVIAEMAVKYSLANETAWEIMTETLSASLTARAGCQVMVGMIGGEVRASYFSEGPFPDARTKGLGGTFGGALKSFRHDLEKAFAQRAARESLVIFRPLIHRVAQGEIIKVADDGGVIAEIENGGFADGKVAACCGSQDFPVRERGKMRPGERYWFYVKSAGVHDLHGLPRLDVQLSRRSKRLLELLLIRELLEKGKCISVPRVRCLHRGKECGFVRSSVPLGRDILAKVGKLLGGEVIRVVP